MNRYNKKIGIFADVQNIYYTTREVYNKAFDYRKFWKLANKKGDIVSAIAYAIERGDRKQQKFQEALRHIGFTVKLKPFIQRRDGTTKGDWDVGITIDMLEMAPRLDVAILLSGDGDFELLLVKLGSDYHCRTEVYSVRELPANALVSAADVHTNIDWDLLL